MYFYYLLPSFVSILNRRQRRRTRKLYMIVVVLIFYFCAFCVFLWLIYKHRMSRIFYVLNRRQRRRTRKLYMIVTVVISCFCAFLRILWLTLRRPVRSSKLVPRLAVVGVVLLAILTDCSSRKQKYLDYDVFPPMESNHRLNGPCRARERDYLSSDSSMCPNMSLSCRSRKKVVAHSLFSSSWNVRICSSRDIL